jgi:hypothetical protein
LVVADRTEDVAATIVAWRLTAATSVLHGNERGVATRSTVVCVARSPSVACLIQCSALQQFPHWRNTPHYFNELIRCYVTCFGTQITRFSESGMIYLT